MNELAPLYVASTATVHTDKHGAYITIGAFVADHQRVDQLRNLLSKLMTGRPTGRLKDYWRKSEDFQSHRGTPISSYRPSPEGEAASSQVRCEGSPGLIR